MKRNEDIRRALFKRMTRAARRSHQSFNSSWLSRNYLWRLFSVKHPIHSLFQCISLFLARLFPLPPPDSFLLHWIFFLSLHINENYSFIWLSQLFWKAIRFVTISCFSPLGTFPIPLCKMNKFLYLLFAIKWNGKFDSECNEKQWNILAQNELRMLILLPFRDFHSNARSTKAFCLFSLI